MALEDIDLTGVETADLLALSRRIEQEYTRRRVLEEASAQADEIATKYLKATGRLAVEDDDGNLPTYVPEYVQPLGAHDAYPLGIFVAQEGKIYRSLRSGNVWAPKLHPELWEEVSAEEVPEPEPQPQLPVWEVGKAYKVDDKFTFESVAYRVVQPHTSAAHWPPNAVPALYAVVR